MPDAELRVLYETLLAAYRDVNPEMSSLGKHLCRRLADGLFSRGARVQIGTTAPTTHIFIHHSVSPLGHVVWTCHRWNQALGYASQAAVGRHIADFIEPGSYEYFKQRAWPELVAAGRIEDVPLVLVTSTRDYLSATLKSEILKNERGGFQRTFAKIKVAVPAALARLASGASCLAFAAG